MARKATEIDRTLFLRVIKEVEQGGPLSNFKALQEEVAQDYNAQKDAELPEIKPAHVYTRLKTQWGETSEDGALTLDGYEIKTRAGKRGKGAKGKRGVDVDRGVLLAAAKTAERDGPLKNFSVLFDTIAQNYNAEAQAGITGATVRTRLIVMGWATETEDTLIFDGYTFSTTKGRRGRRSEKAVRGAKKPSARVSEQTDAPATPTPEKRPAEVSDAPPGAKLPKWRKAFFRAQAGFRAPRNGRPRKGPSEAELQAYVAEKALSHGLTV